MLFFINLLVDLIMELFYFLPQLLIDYITKKKLGSQQYLRLYTRNKHSLLGSFSNLKNVKVLGNNKQEQCKKNQKPFISVSFYVGTIKLSFSTYIRYSNIQKQNVIQLRSLQLHIIYFPLLYPLFHFVSHTTKNIFTT